MDEDLIPITLTLTLLAMPPGAYGISYDIYTHKLEDNLPAGWNSAKCEFFGPLLVLLPP